MCAIKFATPGHISEKNRPYKRIHWNFCVTTPRRTIFRTGSLFLLVFGVFPMPLVLAEPFEGCAYIDAVEPLDWMLALKQAAHYNTQIITVIQEFEKARNGVVAAKTPFLPAISASVQGERYVKVSPQAQTGTVVGTTVVGGQDSMFSNYASVSTTWNLYNGGKDIAGYHAARASEQAADADVLDRSAGVLADLIQAYAALKKAELGARYSARALMRLDGMVNRATQRLARGFGTKIDISRVQVDRENNEQTRLTSCQDAIKYSSQLAQVLGVRLAPGRVYKLSDPIPAVP